MRFMNFIKKFNQEESGQDTIEYVLIGAAVVTALVAGIPALSTMLTGAITSLGLKVSAAITAA